MNIKKKL